MPPKKRTATSTAPRESAIERKIRLQDEATIARLPAEQELVPMKIIRRNDGYIRRYSAWMEKHSLSSKEAYGEDTHFSERGTVMRQKGAYAAAVTSLKQFNTYIVKHVVADLRAQRDADCAQYTHSWLLEFCGSVGLVLSDVEYAAAKTGGPHGCLETLFGAIEAKEKRIQSAWNFAGPLKISPKEQPLTVTKEQCQVLQSADLAYSLSYRLESWVNKLRIYHTGACDEASPVYELARLACEFWSIPETDLHLLPEPNPMLLADEPVRRRAMLNREFGSFSLHPFMLCMNV
jgi:hypothetical protein